MAAVTYSSLASFSSDNQNWSITIPNFDKVVHFIFYFGAAFLGFFFLKARLKQNTTNTRMLTISLVFAVIYGMAIEVLQYSFFPNRSGDVYDAIANSFGAITAILVLKLFFLPKKKVKIGE